MERTIEEINQKIEAGKISVITAAEAKALIKEKGTKHLMENIDVVTCAAFEMHVNALLYLSFGQTDPLIYFSEVLMNNVPAYPAGPTDLILPCVSMSKENNEYSGASVIEDLIKGKDIYLKASGKNLEVFTNKDIETWFNKNNLTQGRLLLGQALTQNNIVATNSGPKDINSNMGTLIAKFENSTYNSSSYLNPLINDPYSNIIGIGTKLWIAGATGIVLGHGSYHNPLQKRNKQDIPVGPGITISAIADIKEMDPKWIRGGYVKSYGPVLYVGIGIPIPLLNEEIANHIAITDENINSTIVDYSIPRRTKPTFGQCTYSELRTSTVVINNKPTLAAPLSSMSYANEICNTLKETIEKKGFTLREKLAPIDLKSELKKLDPKLRETV